MSLNSRPHFLVMHYILRIMTPYIVILSILLGINYVFNFYSTWDGVNLVVRIYLYAFAFLLIYTISISLPSELRDQYSRYGLFTKFIYVVESRIFPFFIIYLITAIFSIVENMNSPYWPYDSFAGIFDDSMSNLVIYSVVLMYVLKIRKRPYVTVPVYLVLIYIYYMINHEFHNNYSAGYMMVGFKILKASFLFFLITWSTKLTVSRFFLNAFFSIFLAVILNTAILGVYHFEYRLLDNRIAKNSVALKLAKFGQTGVLSNLVDDAIQHNDIDLLDQVYPYMQFYRKSFKISETEWKDFLFHDDIPFANRVASYMLKEGVSAPPEEIINFVKQKHAVSPRDLKNSEFLTRLIAVTLNEYGSSSVLTDTIKNADENYLIWVIRVLGETGDCHMMSHILIYLSHVDSDISAAVYDSLKTLSGLDPNQQSKLPHNSVSSIKMFIDYLNNSCK
ncbi:MAG: hypothetical protein PF637_00875 [Spirochaetes bacterium]|jgi:hypothetical protein|nr:hypothetical protein [Spirochaetota bacterium]